MKLETPLQTPGRIKTYQDISRPFHLRSVPPDTDQQRHQEEPNDDLEKHQPAQANDGRLAQILQELQNMESLNPSVALFDSAGLVDSQLCTNATELHALEALTDLGSFRNLKPRYSNFNS